MTERTCNIPDCDRVFLARGYCKKHYYSAGYGFTPKPCRVDGCPDMTTYRGSSQLCTLHAGRMARNGTTDALKFFPRRSQSLVDVLHLRTEPHGDCVVWLGAVDDRGYGCVGRKWGTTRPHRFSYMLAYGPIPEDHHLDHVCHTRDLMCLTDECMHRLCVNPDHLEPVTPEENSRRAGHRHREQAKLLVQLHDQLADVLAQTRT